MNKVSSFKIRHQHWIFKFKKLNLLVNKLIKKNTAIIKYIFYKSFYVFESVVFLKWLTCWKWSMTSLVVIMAVSKKHSHSNELVGGHLTFRNVLIATLVSNLTAWLYGFKTSSSLVVQLTFSFLDYRL